MTLSLEREALRLATAYPLTERQAASFLLICGEDIARAWAAGEAMGQGWEYTRVRSCLLFGEVRTCEQMMAWLRAHPTD